MAFEQINTTADAVRAILELNEASKLAFDCEGVSLGRFGQLTVLTLCPYRPTIKEQRASTAYVFDILTLGSEVFKLGLKQILESSTIQKLTFDCREDSNALLHQYNVRLTNVLDCQIFDQACRLWKGEPMVRQTGGWKTFLPKKSVACARYFSTIEIDELDVNVQGPHKGDDKVWSRRPIAQSSLRYAALDAHAINRMYYWMCKWRVCAELFEAVEEKSEEYVKKFREFHRAIDYKADKDMCALEHPIVNSFTRSSADKARFEVTSKECLEEHASLCYEPVNLAIKQLQAKDDVTEEDLHSIQRLLQAIPSHKFAQVQQWGPMKKGVEAAIEDLRKKADAVLFRALTDSMLAARAVTDPVQVKDILPRLESAISSLQKHQYGRDPLVLEAQQLVTEKKRLADAPLFTVLKQHIDQLHDKEQDSIAYADLIDMIQALKHLKSKYAHDPVIEEANRQLRTWVRQATSPLKDRLQRESIRLNESRTHGLSSVDLSSLITAIVMARTEIGLLSLDVELERDTRLAESLLKDLHEQLIVQEQVRRASMYTGYFDAATMAVLNQKVRKFKLSTEWSVGLSPSQVEAGSSVFHVDIHPSYVSRDFDDRFDDDDFDNTEVNEYEVRRAFDFEDCDQECGYCGQCSRNQHYED